jgi:triacylglycerol lipase
MRILGDAMVIAMALVLAALCVVAACVVLLLWRRKRRLEQLPAERLAHVPRDAAPGDADATPSPAPQRDAHAPRGARLPLVLTHGLLGFDELSIAGQRLEYFRGIRQRLERAGNEVHLVRLPPFGSVEARAEALARALDRIDARRVNVIAHSMGGLDARLVASRYGFADRIASLVTIGTPHRGTPLCDFGALFDKDDLWLRQWLRAVGFDPLALADLGPRRAATFNDKVEDAPEVYYASVLGAVRSDIERRRTPLALVHRWLRARAGDNDVLVPVSSQRWGDVISEIDADHWAQVGWSTRFDAGAFYQELARELRARGF